MLTKDERQILSKLERWEAEITAILDAYGDGGSLHGPEAETVRGMYGRLKDALRAEMRAAGSPTSSTAAGQWYSPAIHDANAHLRVATNGRVDQELYSQLYEALGDIRAMAVPLRARSAEDSA